MQSEASSDKYDAMPKSLPQVRDLIDQLGGGTAVADELNKLLPSTEKRVDREAVYKWKEANEIPHSRRLYMARLAKAKMKALPPQLAEYAGAA